MQTALMIVLYLSLLALCWRRLLTLLNYFQQEEYDNARFVGAWARIRLMDVAASLLVLGSVMVSLSAPVATPYAHAALSAALLAIAYREGRRRFKKPLALTERARRILGLALGFAALLGLLSVVHVVFVALTLQALPFLLIAANAALRPLQNRINKRYLDEGRAKLERLNPLKIGVTGSFGKTTVKHMLGEIIEASGPVFYSRGSINTELGHTRHIRQRLQWAHRYFIAEMGAYGVGSIARLCAFIKPDHGIVTAVGDAHTERFGSIEAIARAKSELVEAVCRAGGVAVVNADVLAHEPFADLRAQYPGKVLSVGGAGADVEVSAQEIEGGSWAISLQAPGGEIPEVSYELPLLGDHNVRNSALAVTLALTVAPEIADRIPFFTRTIAQIPHRLQKRAAPGAALVLDDAYNSNEMGFISAVGALRKLAEERGGRSVLVTPGLAELGLEHDPVHRRLGAHAGAQCDMIFAINPERIPTFMDAARGGSAEVVEVASLDEARAAVSKVVSADDVILYENDLPDLLEDRRIL